VDRDLSILLVLIDLWRAGVPMPKLITVMTALLAGEGVERVIAILLS
jgi:hypothetical protein